MGQTLDKPSVSKQYESGSGNDLRFAVCSMQGWRLDMEDAHTAHPSWDSGFEDCSFYAVFDGHAGSYVSTHSSKELSTFIVENLRKNGFDSMPESSTSPKAEELKKILSDAFVAFDDELKITVNGFGPERFDSSGSTVLVVIITPKLVIFCNCGDSRGALIRNNEVLFSTADHKPSNREERERIENANGHVSLERVNGNLAVSRAFGDFSFKTNSHLESKLQQVSPEPTVTIIDRDHDQFVFLACDGIWDVMSCADVNRYVRTKMLTIEHLEDICADLIDTCLLQNSHDNMTAMIIAFPDAPKLSELEIEMDKEYEKNIEENVVNIYEKEKPQATLSSVIKALSAFDLTPKCASSELGPISKKRLIEKAMNELDPERNIDRDFVVNNSASTFPMALQAIQQLVRADPSENINYFDSPPQESGPESSEVDNEETTG